MKKYILILICVFLGISNGFADADDVIKSIVQPDDSDADIYKIKPTIDTNSVTGVLIPADLESCFSELNTMMTPEFIAEYKAIKKEKHVFRYHHSLGGWLRNNWGLWKGSPLREWFKEKDVHHPDSMSGIIMVSYWRHLNGKPILMDEQIQMRKDFYAKQEKESNQQVEPTVPE